jgi:DHA1 family bicyclomycin/chloramphenicol resistance-like MFS transporter
MSVAASPGRMEPGRTEPIFSRLFLIVGAVTIVGPATMDMYLPGLPQLARSFHTSASSAQLTMTTYVLGLALGQLVAGPRGAGRGRRRPRQRGRGRARE